jgi:hypothetical protein
MRSGRCPSLRATSHRQVPRRKPLRAQALLGCRSLLGPVPQGAHHAPPPLCLAMGSASTRAEPLRLSSLVRRQCRAQRGAVSRPTRAPVCPRPPTTYADPWSDTRSVCTRVGGGTYPGGRRPGSGKGDAGVDDRSTAASGWRRDTGRRCRGGGRTSAPARIRLSCGCEIAAATKWRCAPLAHTFCSDKP